MSLLRIDASIRPEGSVSRGVADSFQSAWLQVHPAGEIVHRDLGASPLPSDAWAAAISAGWTPVENRSPAQHEAVALAATLADELVNADAYLFAVPLYNFGVSQHAKTWIDLIISDPRFGAGAEPILTGRPATLVVARGGGYGPGTPREGWDHGTPWLRRVFADVWGLDLEIVEAELTLAEIVPAMEALRPLAADLREKAHASADERGRSVASRILAA